MYKMYQGFEPQPLLSLIPNPSSLIVIVATIGFKICLEPLCHHCGYVVMLHWWWQP